MAGSYTGYGSTWETVNACCAAVDAGCTDVKLVTPNTHIGGVIINGLGAIDQGRSGTHGIGYLTDKFYNKLNAMIGSGRQQRAVSPFAAEQCFKWLLDTYGVTVYNNMALTSVNMAGAVLTSFVAGGNTFAADIFHDGTDCGDLFGLAGGTKVYGREAAAAYGESLGGFYPVEDSFIPFDCYASPGVLLPGFSVYPALSPGAGDLGVQAYGIRMPITSNAEFRLDWPLPANYDPLQFEYLRRASPLSDVTWQPLRPTPCLFGIGDQNGDWGIPQQWGYPPGNQAARDAIFDYIYSTAYGWMWFLANDPSVNSTTQAFVRTYGPDSRCLPASSPTPHGVPKEPYIRNGSRCIGGGYMMTQADLQTTITKADSLAVGFYSIDCHTVQKLAVVRSGVAGWIGDGVGYADVDLKQVLPYQIPFRCGLPNPTQVINLTLGRCLNMSAVASYSMRIDQQSANFSSGLGMAGGMSAVSGTPLRSLVTADIQAALTSRGQVIAYP